MKLATKLHPKHLFRSSKSPSHPSSSNSSASSPSHGHNNRNRNRNPNPNRKSISIATPTSVLPTQNISISSDEWSEVSTDLQYELVQAFRFIDTDGDGKITREELEAVLNRIGGSEELSLMLTEIDKNGDGVITLEEFGALSSAFGPPACDGELRDVFEFFDTDRDGRITAEELFEVFRSLGDGKCTLEDCRSMIRNVDKNGDGFVCFEDFTRMMDPTLSGF